jgi:tetratricopeptide (TPR) repeat protein
MWRRHEGAAADVVASGLNNLADVVRQQGRVADAVPLLEEAIGIRRQTVGATHPSLALVVGHLGRVYSQQGNAAKAEPLLREALNIRQRVYGHPDTVNTRGDLTSLLRPGRSGGREPLYRTAVNSRRRVSDRAATMRCRSTTSRPCFRISGGSTKPSASTAKSAIRLRLDAPVPQSVARAPCSPMRCSPWAPFRGRNSGASRPRPRRQVFPPGHFRTALGQVLLGKVLAAPPA